MGLLRPSIDHALPMATQLARTVTPRQVQNLEHKYQKVNAEFRETYLQPISRDRLQAATKRAISRAESLYGSLDEAQSARLARGIKASPFDPDAWLAERMRRQQETVRAFRRLVSAGSPPSAEATQAVLKPLVDQALVSPDPGYRAYQERLKQYNCVLVAQLHNSTSRDQRAIAAARLKGWEEDVRSLAGKGGRN